MILQQNGRLIADRPVGPFLIVVSAPSLYFFLGVCNGEEPMGVEAFGPEATVERLDEGIVRCDLAAPGLIQFGVRSGPRSGPEHEA